MKCKTTTCILLILLIAISVYLYIYQLDISYLTLMSKSRDAKNHRLRTEKTVVAYENMDLYLRMTTVNPLFVKLYKSVFVQSMRYFWPDNYSIVVVLDQEKTEDHIFGDTIRQTFPFPRTCFMQAPTVSGYSGFDRMQRDMFYPENCTSKKYVGFVDTDTMFITRVIPGMLFVADKPIIMGIYGTPISWYWSVMAQSTANIFKTNEVMRCMSYFPVIMKVDHIIEMRDYLSKLHNMPFDEVLRKLQSKVTVKEQTTFSQFSLMCQYVWMFHRNEYVFHLQFQRITPKKIVSQRENATYYDTHVKAEQKFPIASVSVHFKYVAGNWRKQETYRHSLRSGICYSGGFELCPEKCIQYRRTSVRRDMFEFESVNWTWDKRCIEAQEKHYREAATYDSLNYSDVIRNACNEVDTLTWSV